MKNTIRCFGCGKELPKPKRQSKNKIQCSKSICDPKWIKYSYAEDEESYWFLYCSKCMKIASEALDKINHRSEYYAKR